MYFCHDMAAVRGRKLSATGVVEHRFSGVLTARSLGVLSSKCLPHALAASAVVVRSDTAALAYVAPVEFDASVLARIALLPPHAIIASEANYAQARTAVEAMVRLGLYATVWLPQHLEQAQRWADVYSRLRGRSIVESPR